MFLSFFLRIQLLQPARNIRRRLLHRVEPGIPGHGPRVVAVLGHELPQPLRLPLAQVPGLFRCRVPGLLHQRADHVGHALVVALGVVDAAPLLVLLLGLLHLVVAAVVVNFHDFCVFSLLLVVEVAEGIVERVLAALADDADDFARGVALHAGFRDDGLFGAGNGKRVGGRGGGVGGGVGGFQGGDGGLVQAALDTARRGAEAGDETEAAVVLRQRGFLVP